MALTHLPRPATCGECGFSTTDVHLFAGHSCDVQSFGGRCEDYPCCGHEAGDCNGLLYGSDEAIKESVYDRIYGRSRGGTVWVCNGCGNEAVGEAPAICPECGSDDIDEDDIIDDYDPYYDDSDY